MTDKINQKRFTDDERGDYLFSDIFDNGKLLGSCHADCKDNFLNKLNELSEENYELKQLLEEIRHEITCIDGLNVFGAHYIRLGYVEVMEDDFTRLDYTELLKKIDKVIK